MKHFLYTATLITVFGQIFGANPQADQQLIKAIRAIDVEAARKALDSGADINTTYQLFSHSDNRLPLISVVNFRKPEKRADAAALVQLLIERGANLEDTDLSDKRTALHDAATDDNMTLAQLLVNKGAGLNPQDRNGYTPLMLAAQTGSQEVFNFLLSKGANVAKKNKMGQTVSGVLKQQIGVRPPEYTTTHQQMLQDLEAYIQGQHLGMSALTGRTASSIPELPRDIVKAIAGYADFTLNQDNK
ncbi:ankyrin repeat domain-containing protein [Candidatus Dependentiae bacterium]|nr:ankyrin repeat domain-containing protein [Candidatus Dependentiae bacterium]